MTQEKIPFLDEESTEEVTNRTMISQIISQNEVEDNFYIKNIYDSINTLSKTVMNDKNFLKNIFFLLKMGRTSDVVNTLNVLTSPSETIKGSEIETLVKYCDVLIIEIEELKNQIVQLLDELARSNIKNIKKKTVLKNFIKKIDGEKKVQEILEEYSNINIKKMKEDLDYYKFENSNLLKEKEILIKKLQKQKNLIGILQNTENSSIGNLSSKLDLLKLEYDITKDDGRKDILKREITDYEKRLNDFLMFNKKK